MKYLILAFPLFIYFELLGRYIFYKIGKDPLDFSFVIGFLFTVAFLYIVGWPISAFNRPSIAYVMLVLIYVLITAILIIKDIKKLNYSFNIKLWLIFIALLAFEIFMSWNRTLGQEHGFDAVYYINYIGYNVDTSSLNSLHPLFGTLPNTWETAVTYVFQSYNYFISSFVYIFQKLFGLIGKTLEFLPTYVWTFQILLHMFFISTSIMSIKELKLKNEILNIALLILLVLFMNNLYYNNCYGFIGNSYRMSIHAMATIFLFRYFDSKDHTDLFLFFMSMLGLCGFSSTGTFATIFILFALFFYLYNKENNLLKYYALVLYVPTMNILCVKLGVKWLVIIATALLFAIVYFLNDWILKLYHNKYLRYGTMLAIPLFLIIMSIPVSNNIFYGFIHNYSEIQDMSWDYFDFLDLRHWVFNLIVLIPLAYHLIKNKSHPFSIVCLVLIVTVFNPFGANFMNKINWVYYRTYDIIINQFTLAYFISYLVSKTSYKTISSGFIMVLSLYLAITQIPSVWHYSFETNEDYNNIYKIQNSELEMIYNVRKLIDDKGLGNVKIINSTFYMNTFIKDSTYLIGKEKRYDYEKYDDLTYALYLIFFPSDDYDNFRPVDKPDYDNVIEYLKQCDYDILVVDYNNFIEYKSEYMQLAKAVTSDGTYTDEGYSTAQYAIIYLNTSE